MRLFWKLFCSTVVITSLACGAGGFYLIDSQFRTGLEREVTAVYEENDLLRYTLGRELANKYLLDQGEITRAADNLKITTGHGVIAFRLSGGNGERISGSGVIPVDASAVGKLPDGKKGWELVPIQGRFYLHAVSPLVLTSGTLYLENCRDVSSLFAMRQEQYRTFLYLMGGLILATALTSLLLTALMLRPLRRLSNASRRMAAGQLHQRVRVDSDDELGRLSADFNTMTEQLEAQVYQLREAAQRQEEFLNSFAHETKTPLTSIIGYADLLRSRAVMPEQVQQSADYIFSEGRRLEALSRKLMDMIVLEKQDFVLHAVPMEGFLTRVAGAMKPVLGGQNIRLLLQAEPAAIPIEPDLIETVCLNLLDNARKAIENSGVILLEGKLQPGGYCISVIDNGKGIPPEELDRITDAFYMVDKSRSRAQGGAGLGLAVCRRIVAIHGGQLRFASELGKGTWVSVFLKGEAADETDQ